MLAFTSDRPLRDNDARGKWTALMLALFVNLLFVAVLVFSVSWQNRKPEAVTAELYAPPVKSTPRPEPQPMQKPEPPPAPVPKAEPPPEPRLAPKPPPPVEKPDQQEAEIALKAKREAERRQQEQAERERAERERAQREQERREAEARRLAEEKREAEIRQRQAQQVEAMRAQAEREARLRAQAERESQLRAQAERESQLRAQAERESQLRAEANQEARQRAAQAAAGAARNKAQQDWIDRIRSRIRGYINLPPDIPGNPEAIFDVVQLPTGEIIDVRLRKSSGVRAYDDAVQRAILKASPLPKAAPAEIFQRNLELRFRPLDQ
jgi:colicin import membrane protein